MKKEDIVHHEEKEPVHIPVVKEAKVEEEEIKEEVLDSQNSENPFQPS